MASCNGNLKLFPPTIVINVNCYVKDSQLNTKHVNLIFVKVTTQRHNGETTIFMITDSSPTHNSQLTASVNLLPQAGFYSKLKVPTKVVHIEHFQTFRKEVFET